MVNNILIILAGVVLLAEYRGRRDPVLAVALDSYQNRSGATIMRPDATRRRWSRRAGMAAGAALSTYVSPERRRGRVRARRSSRRRLQRWTRSTCGSRRTPHLPLFVAHDHPALFQVGRGAGVRVTIVGPDTVDIPGLVAAVEQTAARRPAGMMVVGWDPSALIPAIDRAVESGVPVVCVDADVPAASGWRSSAPTGTTWARARARRWCGALKGGAARWRCWA